MKKDVMCRYDFLWKIEYWKTGRIAESNRIMKNNPISGFEFPI